MMVDLVRFVFKSIFDVRVCAWWQRCFYTLWKSIILNEVLHLLVSKILFLSSDFFLNSNVS